MTSRWTSFRRWLTAEVVTTEKRYALFARGVMRGAMGLVVCGFLYLLVERELWKVQIDGYAWADGAQSARYAFGQGKPISEAELTKFSEEYKTGTLFARIMAYPLWYREQRYIEGVRSFKDCKESETAANTAGTSTP